VTFEQLEKQKRVKTSRQIPCPVCHGTGSSSKSLNICTACTGSGYDLVSTIIGPKKFCNVCKGFGTSSKADCKRCHGRGTISETIIHSFEVPRDLSKIILRNKGSYSIGSDKAGDLIIIPELNDPVFKFQGNRIKGFLNVSPAQAVLGDTILLSEPAVEVIVPPKTSHGDTLRVKDPFGTGFDLNLKVEIDTKKTLSEKEISLFNKLLRLQKGIVS
jgi:molecular chaperone DnaJ